jgi:hypothetical protein
MNYSTPSNRCAKEYNAVDLSPALAAALSDILNCSPTKMTSVRLAFL